MIIALVTALVVIAVALVLVQRRRRRRRRRVIPVAPPVAASEMLVAEPVAMPDVAAVEAATLASRLGGARGVFARLRGAEADAAVRHDDDPTPRGIIHCGLGRVVSRHSA